MKKITYFLFFICSIINLACMQEPLEAPAQEGEGFLNLSFTVDGEPLVATKAVAQVSPEKKINSLFVIVTDDAEPSIIEQSFSVYPNADGSYSCSKNVKVGDKVLFVFANTDYDLSNVNNFDSYGYWYSSNPSIDVNSWNSSNFMMYYGDWNFFPVTKGNTTSVTIDLKRVLNRVTIRSITNNLPGYLTLGFRGAYLSNLKLKPNPSGADDWANKWGRGSDGAAPLFDYDDDLSDFVSPLTLEQQNLSCYWIGDDFSIVDPSETIYEGGDYFIPEYTAFKRGCRLYYYPNNNAVNYDSYSNEAAYTPQRTKLVLVCDIPANSGKIYYYPIPLDSEYLTEGNLSRDFAITINNLGVLDPNAELAKADYDIGMTWAGWTDTVSWIDDSTPVYRPGEFEYQEGHNNDSYVAQRMYLSLPVDDQKQSVIDDMTFTATMTPLNGSSVDASSWITTTYDSSNKVYNLNIACRLPGTLKVKALYDDIYPVAQKSVYIYSPHGFVKDQTLLVTGEDSNAISIIWKTESGDTLNIGNTSTLTDGLYFDSSLYSSLLGSPASNTISWDISPARFSCISSRVASSNLHFRVSSFGSTIGGLYQMARLMMDNGHRYTTPFADRVQSETPLVAKYRFTTPCGIQTNWANIRVENPCVGCYQAKTSGVFTNNDKYPYITYYDYIDNDWYNKGSGNTQVLTGTAPSILHLYNYSWTFSWEWNTSQGYGQSQTYPMSGASSKVSAGAPGSVAQRYRLKIDNTTTKQYANAAGESYIFGSITNSVTGQVLKIPLCAVFIYKNFYYGCLVYDGPGTDASLMSTHSGILTELSAYRPYVYYWYPHFYELGYNDLGSGVNIYFAAPHWSSIAYSRNITDYPDGYMSNYSMSCYGIDSEFTACDEYDYQWSSYMMFTYDNPSTHGQSYNGTQFYRVYPAWDGSILHTPEENR